MVLPRNGFVQPIEGVSGGVAVPVTGIISDVTPGTSITTPADTAVGVGATVALPAIPANTRRMRVQVTTGDTTTRVRIRELGAGAGRGVLIDLLSSTMYGGADGAITALEAENVAGPATTVLVQFERD